MNELTEQQASPVFGLRYLEDREVEGLDVVGCLFVHLTDRRSTAPQPVQRGQEPAVGLRSHRT